MKVLLHNMSKLEKIIQILKKVLELKIELSFRSTPTTLCPLLRRKSEELIARMESLGYKVMVQQGFRSIEEQNYLYAQGRTRAGAIVTNAKGGESLHNYGVAFDITFMADGKPSWDNHWPWDLLGKTGQELGLEWGGSWKNFVDRPHFQMLMGYSLDDFKTKNVDFRKFN